MGVLHIMFAVCACARFQVNPKVSHLYAVKRIFRYLKGQPKLGLWYPKDSPFDLMAFTDSDYAGASLDRKSTTGGCQFVGCRLISWQCKKQTVVANSTTEAEYIAASNCCGQNADFAEIVDFLNANPIRYALTISPTIYVSCIEQFWSTARIKTVNNETQIHAKAEGKTIVISESSMRRDLQFDDADGSGPRVNTLGSGEDRLGLKELMDLCIKLSDRVLDLETTKTAQAKEIASLKKRVKKLEMKRKSKTPGMNLFKIGTSKRRSLGEEDASKQGRNLKQGKQSSIFEERKFDDEGFDADMDEVFKDVDEDAEQVISASADEVPTGDAVNTVGTGVNTASAPVTTAGVSVSTAKPITTASVNITTAEPITPPPPTTTTTVFEDEDLIIAQTLMKMRSEKSKVRGVVMQESSETATRSNLAPFSFHFDPF
ncbi:hypothetical protein Tco_1266354 [Tanacetum coccineum]